MRFLVALSAVVLAATAMPTEIGEKASNATFYSSQLMGFGSGTMGGHNGQTINVHDPWALRDALDSNNRRVVNIRGRIDLKRLWTGSPGVQLRVGSYTTIMGADRNAELYGGGLAINRQSHVIIQNIKITNALSYRQGEQPSGNGFIANQQPGGWSFIDSIDIGNSHHVWVNHCEFSDDPWVAANTPDSSRRHDGLIDITKGSNFVTVSNSIFRNHNLVTLIGSSDNDAWQDNGKLKVTFYLNWYQGVEQRNPRVRFGQVHVLNNLYTNVRSYGIGVGAGAQIYAERNAFFNTRRSWGLANNQNNPIGYLFNDNNHLSNSGHDSKVPSNVNWRPSQYYRYSPMAAVNVDAHVRRHAGTY